MKRYTTHPTTPIFLNKMRHHKVPYKTRIKGVQIIVYPGVWSPAYDWTGEFMVENMSDVKGKRVLEIGCGSGMISLFAALRGATSVYSIDINPLAIQNTRKNFILHRVQSRCKAQVSDVFQKVKGTYDVILFNAPFHGSRANSILERAVSDHGYRALKKFFKQVGEYVDKGTVIDIAFSESGDNALLQQLIYLSGLTLKSKVTDWRKGYSCDLYRLEA
jgi:release factor glutamine methyltransferase